MVPVVAIVIAVISLVGTLLTAGVTAYLGHFTDKKKRLTEAEKLVAKYRDPLLLACQDLHSRLYNILEWNIIKFLSTNGPKRDNLLIYTAYVVGQYFSWTHILRRQAQFFQLDTEKGSQEITKVLAKIVGLFSTDSLNDKNGSPWMVWRGDQMAIGEVMTVKEDAEMFPMGYADFYKKWMVNGKVIDLSSADKMRDSNAADTNIDNAAFRARFFPIIEGVLIIGEKMNAKAKDNSITVPDQRLRCLQHRFVDLLGVLDPQNLRSEAEYKSRCHKADGCECLCCSRTQSCPCPKCTEKKNANTV